MTRDQAVSLILNRVGQRGGLFGPLDANLQAQVITEIQVQQEELEDGSALGFMPWFLETDYTNGAFVTSASSALVALPTGFLREWDDEPVTLFYQDATQSDPWVPLVKDDFNALKVNLGETPAGKPAGYCLVGANIKVFPNPDAVYALRQLCYIGDTSLSTNVENNWLKYAGGLLVGRTGKVVAGYGIRDEEATAFFTDMETKGLDALLRTHTARKEAGRMRMMGDED